MPGQTNLSELLKTMSPRLNDGEYVFCTIPLTQTIDQKSIIGTFNEVEGTTVILERSKADELDLSYSYISSWITLTVHSSLEAVGLTAAFSNALAKEGISCNVVAAYYHDHIFVDKRDADSAIKALKKLSADNN